MVVYDVHWREHSKAFEKGYNTLRLIFENHVVDNLSTREKESLIMREIQNSIRDDDPLILEIVECVRNLCCLRYHCEDDADMVRFGYESEPDENGETGENFLLRSRMSGYRFSCRADAVTGD
jgi:hypothetical protein